MAATDFSDDWGDSYAESARIERHRLRARPSEQTGKIEDEYARDEPEAEELEGLQE